MEGPAFQSGHGNRPAKPWHALNAQAALEGTRTSLLRIAMNRCLASNGIASFRVDVADSRRIDQDHHGLISVKGAPEQVLAMCTTQRRAANDTEILDQDFWHEKAANIAEQGQRVLAFATRAVPSQQQVLHISDLEGHNIKKVISRTLPTSAGEALTIIVALLLGLALPVTPIQILWVNLITATHWALRWRSSQPRPAPCAARREAGTKPC